MIASLHFEFGKIDVFNYFVVVVMKEGITVLPEYNNELVKIKNQYFENKLFGYITLRINSYSVDPRVYLETNKIKNLIAFAVVCENELNISNIEVEKIFIKKPFKHFKKLSDAKSWINQIIVTSKKDLSTI